MNKQPIQPAYGSGVTVSPGAASATSPITRGNKQLILSNAGANPCYVHVGVGAVVAGTDDYYVPAGAQVVVTKAQDDNVIAHFSPLGTTLHYMNGEGF